MYVSQYEMDEKGTKYRWPVFISTFLSYIFDNYDNVILAISMPVLISVLNISYAQGGLLVSVTMVGAALGSIIFGTVAENRGRRFALIFSLVAFGLGTGVIIFVDDWEHWMILRFFTGIAIGGVWGPCVALVMEHWAPAYQSRVTSLVLSMFAVAFVFASFAGRIFLTIDWRILFLLGMLSIPIAIYTYVTVPADTVSSGPKEKNRRSVFLTALSARRLNGLSWGRRWYSSAWAPSGARRRGFRPSSLRSEDSAWS